MAQPETLADIKKYDASAMIDLLESFPEQCRQASKLGEEFDLPRSFRTGYSNIVCTGMGGSAIGADIIRSYVSDEAALPILVNRNYNLPNFVGKDSLVIVSSYSGNTEETISAYKDARSRGARVIAITSGGKIKKLATDDTFPVLTIPGGLPPRCALGFSSFTFLSVLMKLGVVKDKTRQIDRAINTMQNLKDEFMSQAKLIARKLYLKYPVIYAGQDHIDAVATRWRGQLAENAKTISSSHVIPEMNHNEIVGWKNPAKILKDFIVIMLKDQSDHPRVSKRMKITKDIIESLKVETIEVESAGKELLERIFSLVYIGDFVSFYLAILNKEDPTPVEKINYLKEELGKV